MDLDRNAELVRQLEGHWEHQLRPRLDGLTDEEYSWEPALENLLGRKPTTFRDVLAATLAG